jgi:hypothetical protein
MKKNLIYHIYAEADKEILYNNLSYISAFDHIFDNCYYKIVYNDLEKTKEILGPFLKRKNKSFDFYKNNPSLGEVVGFIDAMEKSLRDPEAITYVGTTAGVSKPGPQAPNIHAWVHAIYLTLLGNIPRIEQHFLDGAQSVGIFKKTFPMEKGGPRPAPWHYSGAQYWISNKALLTTKWKDIAICRHGVEMYPGYMLPVSKAVSLFNTNTDLYLTKLDFSEWVPTL